jgi:Arc/MetJ-type ribon-helix-helix transcriptional regulator
MKYYSRKTILKGISFTPDDLIQVDRLVASGKHESRSGAVRAGIKLLLSQITIEKKG